MTRQDRSDRRRDATDLSPSELADDAVADAATGDRRGRLDGVAYRWVAMGVVLFGTFMVVLDTTIVNLGLPALQRDFDAAGSIEWVVTSYLAAVGVSHAASGWIGDRFGRKRSFVAALVIFTVASLLCAVSVNLPMLVAARILKGVGGGLLMPVAMAMIYELFEPEERGRAISYFGIAVMVAPALGPVLGGGLVSWVGWRWLFLINVPIGIVGVPIALRLLRDTGHREHRRFDATGLVLVGIGLSLLLIGVERGGVEGWANPMVVGGTVVGAAVLVLFILHARRTTAPLVEVRMFANPIFALGMCSIALMSIAQFSRLVYVPLELGNVRDVSELWIGVVMMPTAVGMAMTMPIGGRLTDRVGARLPSTIGLAILGASFIAMAAFTTTTSLWVMALVLFVGGLGTGLSMMSPNILAMNSVRVQQVSQASGLSNVSRQMSAAIGTAVMASIFAASGGVAETEAAVTEAGRDPYRTVFLVGGGLVMLGVIVAQFLPGKATALALQRARRQEVDAMGGAAPSAPPH